MLLTTLFMGCSTTLLKPVFINREQLARFLPCTINDEIIDEILHIRCYIILHVRIFFNSDYVELVVDLTKESHKSIGVQM